MVRMWTSERERRSPGGEEGVVACDDVRRVGSVPVN